MYYFILATLVVGVLVSQYSIYSLELLRNNSNSFLSNNIKAPNPKFFALKIQNVLRVTHDFNFRFSLKVFYKGYSCCAMHT